LPDCVQDDFKKIPFLKNPIEFGDSLKCIRVQMTQDVTPRWWGGCLFLPPLAERCDRQNGEQRGLTPQTLSRHVSARGKAFRNLLLESRADSLAMLLLMPTSLPRQPKQGGQWRLDNPISGRLSSDWPAVLT